MYNTATKSKKGGLNTFTDKLRHMAKLPRADLYDANLARTASTCTATAYTGCCSRGSLNDAVTVAQLNNVTDALHGLIASEAGLLDELLLKDAVLPDVVLDLQSSMRLRQCCDYTLAHENTKMLMQDAAARTQWQAQV